MAGYDINVEKGLLSGLLSGQNGLANLVEAVLNQILEAQVTETLGADRHEHSEGRQGYRNGYRARTLYTRVGSRSPCKCHRLAMAVSRPKFSNAISAVNKRSCWP